MVTGALIAATVASTAISASAASKAGKAQSGAAKDDLALQREIFEATQANQQPFIESGQLALEGLLFELGLGDAPTVGGTAGFRVGDNEFSTREAAESFINEKIPLGPSGGLVFVEDGREGGFKIVEASSRLGGGGGSKKRGGTIEEFNEGGRLFEGFQESPGFKFALSQGIGAVDASAAASGSLFSGSTLQALTEFGQNFAGLARGTFLDRLQNISGAGQNAVNQLAQSSASFGEGSSRALSGLGNAQAAGAIGQANALNSGLNSLTTIIGGGLGG